MISVMLTRKQFIEDPPLWVLAATIIGTVCLSLVPLVILLVYG